MSYQRVIPRDLFNESSLLKCYGRLSILLGETAGHRARLIHDGAPFAISQDPSDGSITISNVHLIVSDALQSIFTEHVRLYRPLNSREPWPLYAMRADDEEVAVFDDQGWLTDQMRRLIGL